MKTKTSYTTLNTPRGELVLVANESELTGVYFEDHDHIPPTRKEWVRDPKHPVLREAEKQLNEYFAGKRTEFSLPLHFDGTDFQNRVWQQIALIPFGKTISYSELAKKAGKPQAIRAAGTNTGRNPLAIVIPCHRVLAKDGGIGGFAGGLDWKRHLLGIEKISVPKS
jgi:methylated-DNA-[protein]-cysteine S-methyltransferase